MPSWHLVPVRLPQSRAPNFARRPSPYARHDRLGAGVDHGVRMPERLADRLDRLHRLPGAASPACCLGNAVGFSRAGGRQEMCGPRLPAATNLRENRCSARRLSKFARTYASAWPGASESLPWAALHALGVGRGLWVDIRVRALPDFGRPTMISSPTPLGRPSPIGAPTGGGLEVHICRAQPEASRRDACLSRRAGTPRSSARLLTLG
jgi:hypothetical protein